MPEVGRAGNHRRNLRTHHLRRRRACFPDYPGRYAGAYDRRQWHVEDLQRYGMARRLHYCASANYGRDPQDARFHDRGRTRSAAGSRGGGAPSGGLLLCGACQAVPGPARPPAIHAPARRLRSFCSSWRLLHHVQHPPLPRPLGTCR